MNENAGTRPRIFAVLVALLEVEGEECILLTKRPEHPRDPYSGQICLPGGALEASDASLADCALREAREEVGIDPSQVKLSCELDWHETSLHHRVKPFVGHVRPPYRIVPSSTEVEKILYLPLRGVCRRMFARRGTWQGSDGVEQDILSFKLEGHEVWGLTARILYDYLFGEARKR